MTNLTPPIYEVETRFYFFNTDEVWNVLPVFQPYINLNSSSVTLFPARYEKSQPVKGLLYSVTK